MRKAIMGLSLLAAIAGCSPGKEKQEALDAVTAFHGQLNSGAYEEIYRASSRDMKSVTAAPEFVRFLKMVHDRLGDIRHSKEAGWHVNYGTNGTIVTLVHETQFTKGTAREQFLYRMNEGAPQLVGYHVSSPQLVGG
jgi:hypothetical protein